MIVKTQTTSEKTKLDPTKKNSKQSYPCPKRLGNQGQETHNDGFN